MKMWKKILLIMMAALFLCLGLCGGAILYRTGEASVRREEEHFALQLRTVASGFERSVDWETFARMSGVVQNSYLQFQFKRWCGSGYVLIREGRPLINLTDYDIVDAGAMDDPMMIQRLGEKRILLQKQEIGERPEYEILSAQDISGVYGQIGELAIFTVALCVTVFCVSGLVLVLLIRRSFRPLADLERAAKGIGAGELHLRAAVISRDEIGQVGQAFNQMAEKVENQVEDLRILLGALTHEIKTPMTAIIGYSDSLLHVNLKEEQRERALAYIYSEGKRLEQLCGKMMSLIGGYENHSVKMEWLPADILFQEVQKSEEPYLARRGLSLMTEWEPGREYYADRELMRSLLGNLIRNGANASQKGDRICLRGTKEGIEVEDHGCGIPQAEIKNVTKAFYRIDQSRSHKAGGAGLGLALCCRIAEVHRGKIEISSKEGEGTLVKVIFPDIYKKITSR